MLLDRLYGIEAAKVNNLICPFDGGHLLLENTTNILIAKSEKLRCPKCLKIFYRSSSVLTTQILIDPDS